jgi:hypothetical protein
MRGLDVRQLNASIVIRNAERPSAPVMKVIARHTPCPGDSASSTGTVTSRPALVVTDFTARYGERLWRRADLAPDPRPCFTPNQSRSACAGGAHEAATVHALLGSAAAAWPIATHAQPAIPGTARVGILSGASLATPANARFRKAFVEALRQRGWEEGKNLAVETSMLIASYEVPNQPTCRSSGPPSSCAMTTGASCRHSKRTTCQS